MTLPLSMDARTAMPIIGISVGIVFGFLLGVFLVLSVQSSIYSLSYLKSLVNAYRVLIRSFVWMLLFALLPLGLYLLRGINGFPIFIYILLFCMVVWEWGWCSAEIRRVYPEDISGTLVPSTRYHIETTKKHAIN